MKIPKHKKRHLELVLVSMIDMFTILIIYLLSQTSTKYGGIIADGSVRLPSSTSREAATDTFKIVITKLDISVNSTVLVQLDGNGKFKAGDLEGLFVRKLGTYLEANRPPDQGPDKGPSVIIIADRTVPFETVRNVMFTTGQQAVPDFRFAVLKKAPT